jgi:hypothetical protein
MQLIDPKVFGGSQFDGLAKARLTPSVAGNPPFLRVKATGETFPWSEQLADRGDLVEAAYEFVPEKRKAIMPPQRPPRFDGGAQSPRLAATETNDVNAIATA